MTGGVLEGITGARDDFALQPQCLHRGPNTFSSLMDGLLVTDPKMNLASEFVICSPKLLQKPTDEPPIATEWLDHF